MKVQLILAFIWLLADVNTTTLQLAGGKTIKVEVVTSDEQLGKGLSGRPPLPPDTGVLFAYRTEVRATAHLLYYRMPVDIVWMDKNKTIVNLRENALPCPKLPCAGYDSIWMFQYALELPAGTVKRLNIRGGHVLSFNLPAPKR